MEENPGAGDIRSESTRLRESRVLRLDQDRLGRLFGVAQKFIGNKVGHEVQCSDHSKRTSGAAQLIADTDRQENLVPYRWHVALYPKLAPLDDEINIGTGLRFTFRIFTLANAVGPNRQWFRDPMEG